MATQKRKRQPSADVEAEALTDALYQQIMAQDVLSLKSSDRQVWTRVLRTADGKFFCLILLYQETLGRYKWVWTHELEETLEPAEAMARRCINNYERDLKSGKITWRPVPE